MSKINAKLSKELFTINNQKDLEAWLNEAKKSLGGERWEPLGQNENNVHTVEVASDPALALIERPTNSIDALLDLKHLELRQDAASPHEAAQKWFGVPKGGLSEASDKGGFTRLNLAGPNSDHGPRVRRWQPTDNLDPRPGHRPASRQLRRHASFVAWF